MATRKGLHLLSDNKNNKILALLMGQWFFSYSYLQSYKAADSLFEL